VALRSVLGETNAKGSEMSRPPEPQFLVDYREWIKAGPPKCCHTCEMYGTDGLCTEFFMTPPADFAAEVNACPKWEPECPF
jgi:hypothetical protein